MKEYKKRKLLDFMNNKENRMLVVWFFTLITYIILFFLFRNTFVLLFSYFICYLIYSKLYDYIYNKLADTYLYKFLDEIENNKNTSSTEKDHRA